MINKILFLALDKTLVNFLSDLTDQFEVCTIESEEDFENQFEEIADGQFAFCACGPTLGNEFSSEVAQVLNCQAPSTPSFYFGFDKENFRASEFEKNGFKKAFLLPLEAELLRDAVIDSIDPSALNQRLYKSVRMIDITPETNLSFDTFVYMPLNKKYIRFSNADESISDKKLSKLSQHQVASVYIDQADSEKFYEYSAEQLVAIGSSETMSETEKSQRLKESVGGLVSDIFDASGEASFDKGKEMLANSQKIVSNIITGGESSNWYAQVVKSVGGQTGNLSHSAEVSTFAALFAVGLQLENVKEIALAALFHDLSTGDLPEEIVTLPLKDMNSEQLKLWHDHPRRSIDLVKAKKIILNQKIEKIILQHHEKFDGSGFPKGLQGDMIDINSQILSFADQFQYLSIIEEGQKRLKPVEIFDSIAKNGSIGPELIFKLKKLFKDGADNENVEDESVEQEAS